MIERVSRATIEAMRPPTLAVTLFALAAFVGCGASPAAGVDGGATGSLPCTGPPMPTVHIGPDLAIQAFCGTSTEAAVASVDERGHGVTKFSLSVAGDPEFSVKEEVVTVCQANGPTVASVQFAPTLDKRPGQTFDAIVTVRADDGSFPDGQVRVHAEIVVPSVVVSAKTIDFGEVPLGATAMHTLSLIAPSPSVSLTLGNFVNSDFAIDWTPTVAMKANPDLQIWTVSFTASTPGDHVREITWNAGPIVTGDIPECNATGTVTVRAHVHAPDGGAGDEAADGGVDSP